MKLTILIITVFLLQVSALTKAQITLHAKQEPLRKVLEKLSQQSGYDFVYNDQTISTANPVNVNLINVSIEYALNACFDKQPLMYEVSDKTVMIKKKEPTFLERLADRWAAIDVHGRVVDSEGRPLPGASVKVKATGKTVSTDANGKFQLKDVEEGATLVITFIGYQNKEVPAAKEMGNIPLELSDSKLDEVQIIAYGTTTQRLNTGNVSTIKAEEIEKQPINNPLQAIQGRVAGLFITQDSGVPGAGFTVQIRGRNSIEQGVDPFYIIDGVPYTNNLLSNTGGQIIGAGNPLNYINPADIESIDILKDADATAIYGSRGANGVILITTRKGKTGQTHINLDAYTGVSHINSKAKLLNGPQYIEMRKEAYANDGITPGPTIYDLTGAWDIKKSTDWQKELMDNNASVTNIQTAVSGGNEISQYTFGGGYRKEKPMFPGNFSDQKVSVHFKLNTSGFNNKFKAMLSGNFLSDNNLLPTIDITTQALSLPPNAPDGFNADGTINWQNGTYSSNPYQFLLSQYRGKTNNLVASSLLSYDILPGLQLKSSFGYNLMHVREINNKTIASQLNFPGAAAPSASAKFSDNNISSWIIEPQITYEQNIGKGKLSGLLGLTLQQNLFDGQIILAEGYTNDAFLGSLAAASQISKDASPYEQYKYTAAYGRVNYNFADRYILNLTARRDGSSRFGPGKQFGNFGAIGAAWLFTNESFLKDKLLPLSFGKLRASYGTVGNQPASNYGYLELYDFNTGSLSYQGGQALKPINIYAPDFSWEVSEKLEVGIELGFLQDKVLFSASYFRNHSDNQLVSYSLPKISGFSSITANLPAKVENKGWEFTLNTTNISSKSFTWSSSFNFTASENRLQSFPGIENTYYNSSLIIGKSLGITKAYNYARVDPETGVYQFYNASGALTFTPDFDLDRTVLIDTDPKFYGGLQNNFSYGNFELGVFFTFVKQQGLTPAFTYNNPPGASRLNRYAEALDRWQKTGDEATYQKFTSRNFGEVYDAYKYAQESSFAYTDASYIRLKNLSLAWRLPKALQQKMGLSNMRIYVHGQNLLTITGYKGVDPEAQSVTALPPLRVWTAGIQLTL